MPISALLLIVSFHFGSSLAADQVDPTFFTSSISVRAAGIGTTSVQIATTTSMTKMVMAAVVQPHRKRSLENFYVEGHFADEDPWSEQSESIQMAPVSGSKQCSTRTLVFDSPLRFRTAFNLNTTARLAGCGSAKVFTVNEIVSEAAAGYEVHTTYRAGSDDKMLETTESYTQDKLTWAQAHLVLCGNSVDYFLKYDEARSRNSPPHIPFAFLLSSVESACK